MKNAWFWLLMKLTAAVQIMLSKPWKCLSIFDVQGLTVLIPNNKQALRCAVQAVYHTTDLKDYLQKFFSRNEVYQLNLEKSFCTLVNQYISPKTLKHAIEIDIISQIEEVKKN